MSRCDTEPGFKPCWSMPMGLAAPFVTAWAILMGGGCDTWASAEPSKMPFLYRAEWAGHVAECEQPEPIHGFYFCVGDEYGAEADAKRCDSPLVDGAQNRMARAIHEELSTVRHEHARAAVPGAKRSRAWRDVSPVIRDNYRRVAAAARRAYDRERRHAQSMCIYCYGETLGNQCEACGMAQPEPAHLALAFDRTAAGRAFAAGLLLRMAQEHRDAAEVTAERAHGRTGDSFIAEELETAAELIVANMDAWERRGWKSPPLGWRWVDPWEAPFDVRQEGVLRLWGDAEVARLWQEPWRTNHKEVWDSIERVFGLEIECCDGCGEWTAVTTTGDAGMAALCGDCRERCMQEEVQLHGIIEAKLAADVAKHAANAKRFENAWNAAAFDRDHAKEEWGKQRRAARLWKALAKRYRNEGAIAKLMDNVVGAAIDVMKTIPAPPMGLMASPPFESVPNPAKPKICGAKHAMGLVCSKPCGHDLPHEAYAGSKGVRHEWSTRRGFVRLPDRGVVLMGPEELDGPHWTDNQYDGEKKLEKGPLDAPHDPANPELCGARSWVPGLTCTRPEHDAGTFCVGEAPSGFTLRWFEDKPKFDVRMEDGSWRSVDWADVPYYTGVQLWTSRPQEPMFLASAAQKKTPETTAIVPGLDDYIYSTSKGLDENRYSNAKGGT